MPNIQANGELQGQRLRKTQKCQFLLYVQSAQSFPGASKAICSLGSHGKPSSSLLSLKWYIFKLFIYFII